ncbi:HAD-IB family phosphatase [Candidatus Woesearchaeota archaeon]|nr:HAD-IB family phosphatase [Candidatus Woesearchaeota archaeon]
MPKLLVSDMEGTIFRKAIKDSKFGIAPSAWTLMAEHLGPECLAEENKIKEKLSKERYPTVEWVPDSARLLQKYGLKKSLFDYVLSLVEYHPRIHETFKILREAGIKTALVSGGFKAQADKAQIDLKIDHSFTACEFFWDKEGNLEHWNCLPADYEGKLDFMKLVIREYGFDPEECAFVGDGINDVILAKAVGTSIAFNAHHDLQKAATYVINQLKGQEDFMAILPYLGLAIQ